MTTLRIEGPFDMEHVPGWRRAIFQCLEPRQDVEIDLSGLTHIDGSGLASLVGMFQTARRRGFDCTISGASDAVRRIIELNRLGSVLRLRRRH
jgi:anti-anti-sigma factor